MPDPLTPRAEGRLIGHYRLRELIGEGGMGEVYLAEREGDFRQQVAIKLIRAGMANPEVVRRFVIERQTLAALHHPNIVRLLDGGATEEGLPYLVVEYVKGTAIDLYCDAAKLTRADRLRLFVEVSLAVHHAHQSLIVHCDLKPGNILVTPEGRPMLLDFGIAKLLDPVSIGIALHTAETRLHSYTACYASPEQLHKEPVRTASDIYSLGVILYELLTGRCPYSINEDTSIVDMVHAVCDEDPQPPNIDEDLDAIVLKALRKRPEDRYGSVDQMAEDIRRYLDGRPVLARRNTSRYVIAKFLRRHKLGTAASILLAISLTAGIGATLWQARVAARRFDDVRRLARTFLFDVHDAIQDLPGTNTARALIAKTGTEYLDRLALDSAKDLSLQLELAEGYLKIGDVEGDPYSSNLGNSAKAVDCYRKGLSIAAPVLAARPNDAKARHLTAEAHYRLAGILPFSASLDEALEHAKASLQLVIRIAAADLNNPEAQLDVARGYEGLGDILGGLQGMNLGRASEAKDAYRQALEMLPTLPAGHASAFRAARSKGICLTKLGDMEENAGNNDAAFANYRGALEGIEALYTSGPASARVTGVFTAILNRLASLEGSLGQLKAASEHYLRAAEINEAALRVDPDNERSRTNSITTQKNLGDLYMYSLNNYTDALRSYRRAAELLEIECRVDPKKIVWRQRLAEVLTCIATCLLETGQPQEGRREAARGLLVAKQVADSPSATQDQIYNYAWLSVTVDPADLRDFAGALPYAKKAIAMSDPPRPVMLHVLAQTYAGLKDYRHAVEAEEQASALFPPADPAKPLTRNQSIILQALQDYRQELAKK